MATYDDAELQSFYELHNARHEASDWKGLGDLFTDDGSYFDVIWGWSHGKEAIHTFLHDSMQGLDDWTFPIHFVLMGGDRIVTHWHNQLPGTRADGSRYETPGASIITYAGDGRMSQQMDLYDSKAILKVMKEWNEAQSS